MTTTSSMQDPQYEAMLNAMQRGDWARAQEYLTQLQAQYPDDPELEVMASDIRYKSKLQGYWSSRLTALTARWPRIDSARLLRWAIGLAVIGIILYLVWSINTGLLQPRFHVQAEASQVAQLLVEGDQAYASGDYSTAMSSYLKAEKMDSGNPDIEAAIARARTKLDVAQKYEQALKAIDNLNYTEAEQLLLEIQGQSPHYSNVDDLLPQIHKQAQMNALFYDAEVAYERQQWQKAIAGYEQILTIDASFHQKNVKAHLTEAYSHLAQAELNTDTLTPTMVDGAIEFLRKQIRLDPDNRTALEQVTQLALYKQALSALQQQDYLTAAPILEQIMQQSHDLLGQRINRDLYNAYLGLGDAAMANGETQAATDYYAKATNVPDVDPAEAQLRLEVSMARIPPTPTATPTLTPTPAPPTATPVIPSPTPVPTATPAPITWYKGWIAFISDRDGDKGLFVMRPDGKGVRRLRDADKDVYKQIYEHEHWSSDGTTHVYAENASPDRQDTNIFIFREDLPATWERRFMLTDWGGMEYDSVWSPDDQWIAFVANQTGNDEIWLMHTDGSDKTQLTFNSWEWDKHPTWSPDSQNIAFYSNRVSGRLQIWIMNVDGTAQQNISNDDYNDWDPVWIK